MEIVLDKKQIWAILLFEYITGHKAVEIAPLVDNSFDPKTDEQHTVWS